MYLKSSDCTVRVVDVAAEGWDGYKNVLFGVYFALQNKYENTQFASIRVL